MSIEQLITEHLDIWTAADTEKKSGRGRSSGTAGNVYGIKKLRELILELAVRGKLVPQDASDEPASELLKRIAAEKAKLVAEGKIKKSKPLAEITDDEKPFELPQGWEWVNLGSIIDVTSSKRIHVNDYVSEGVPFFRSKEIGELQRGVSISTDLYIAKEKYESLRDLAGFPQTNDLMLTSVGSIGNSWLSDGREFYYKDGNITKLGASRLLSMRFVQNFIGSPLFDHQVTNTVSGTAYNALTIVKLNALTFPLPPLNEQHRIVAKVDELMALCDQLENQHNNAAEAHEKLVTHLLGTLTQSQNAEDFNTNWQRISEHFDTLFTTEASIDALKQTLLQLAVMGKLVPQDPNDEPASELLKRIQAEKAKLIAEGKIKKDKPLAAISEEEKPFDLPVGWEWTSLASISLINPRNYSEDNISASFVPMTMINTSYKTCHDQEPRLWKDIKQGFTHFAEGDIGVAKITPCFENSKACVFKGLLNGLGAGTTELHIIRPIGTSLVSRYVLAYLKSPQFLLVGETKMTGTAGQKRLPKDFIETNPFPLPPILEQKRIVDKVDELFAICDQLKSCLTAANQLQQKLADVLVEQAVN